MQQKQLIILYHAYGSLSIHQQVIFSILTLHYHINSSYEGIQIVVYTDNTKYYKELIGNLPISFEILTNQQIDEFKGEHKFIHRIKIAIIKDCFEKYKKDVLYVDSDTYFTKSPKVLLTKIDASTSIMNSNDYDLNNADELYENEDWLLIRRAIRDFEYDIEESRIKIPLSTRMWNAGVIGLSYENKKILDSVFKLTDQIYANRQVFTAEQFSFSYFLQTKTKLVDSGDVIFHYWPNYVGKKWKDLYSYHFLRFFQQTKNDGFNQKAFLAVELTKKHEEITKSSSIHIIVRMIRRIKLAYKILAKGKV
jgi:hypothetical protein